MLTFGIEEEFVFLDPATQAPVHVAPAIQRRLLATGYSPAVVHHKFFQPQIEFASPVYGLSGRRNAKISPCIETTMGAHEDVPYKREAYPSQLEGASKS